MAYELVLLDFDGTLADFKAAQKKAIQIVLEQAGLTFSQKALDTYARCNDYYWDLLEKGQVTKKELETARFEDFGKSMGYAVDAVQMNRLYMEKLHQCKPLYLYEEAETVCRELAQRAAIIIATNGSADGQRTAIMSSAVAPYIKGIAVSEGAGFAKPDVRFFHHALSLYDITDKEKIIMVGDSLSADIAGGINFGVDTCWFNPSGLPLPEGIKPTYEIGRLSQKKAAPGAKQHACQNLHRLSWNKSLINGKRL